MKYLNPKKIEAAMIELVSWGYRGEEKIERRVTLGLFTPDVSVDDIAHIIKEEGLQPNLMGSASIAGGEFFFNRRTAQVVEGVIFESADEFSRFLKNGVDWSDISEGVKIVGDMGYDSLEI